LRSACNVVISLEVIGCLLLLFCVWTAIGRVDSLCVVVLEKIIVVWVLNCSTTTDPKCGSRGVIVRLIGFLVELFDVCGLRETIV